MTTAQRGLFLDFDGTLCDSLTALRGVHRDFLASFGRVATADEFDTLNGPPLAAVVETLRQRHDLPGDAADLLALYRRLALAAHGEAPVAPGGAELLRHAGQAGWKVWIVTSAPAASVRAWLRLRGLEADVAGVVGGDDVARGKPDPAPYRLALARAGCAAAQSVAVEDSLQGAQAALAADLPTWLVAASGGDGLAETGSLNGHGRYLGVLHGLNDPRLLGRRTPSPGVATGARP